MGSWRLLCQAFRGEGAGRNDGAVEEAEKFSSDGLRDEGQELYQCIRLHVGPLSSKAAFGTVYGSECYRRVPRE